MRRLRAMPFKGFPKETLEFLAALRTNNDKKWFDAHRADYESYFVEPAKDFVAALAPRLKTIDRKIHAEPRINGSILRIQRDVRFARDKSPYKDHLDLWFWTGEEKGWDSSGFFLRLTPDMLVLGAGMHAFGGAKLARYRRAVLDAKKGAALAKAVARARKDGYEVGEERYINTPKGTPHDHPRASLLKHGALYAGWQGGHPKELHRSAFVPFVTRHYKAIAPIHAWLRAI